jgi:hypothetical protein
MAAVLLAGKVSRLAGAMEASGPACTFRLGSVPCHATGDLALLLVERAGYPAHEIEVSGELLVEGKKKVLAISSLRLLD